MDTVGYILDEQESDSLRAYVGARVARPIKISQRLTLVPELRAAYERDLLGSGRTVTARLDSGEGAAFQTRYAAPDESRFDLGFGLSALLGEDWYLRLYYVTELGGDQESNHSITANFGLSF